MQITKEYGIQHNHHCLLSFNGGNWMITGVAGVDWVEVLELDPPKWEIDPRAVLDLSTVRWDEYIPKALAMDYKAQEMASDNRTEAVDGHYHNRNGGSARA